MSSDSRIVAFSVRGKSGYGLTRDGGVIDLSRRYAGTWPTLRHAIEAGTLARIAEEVGNADIDLPLADIIFEPPIPSCAKIICVGVNYPDRAKEYGVGASVPKNPSLFSRFANSLVGHEIPLERPAASNQLDYAAT
jgi:2-keto-4-pentenoate hydratase/2-oxohepta-3-ene-1,7-dioic acid hydratase in catechol pathway